MVGLKKLTGCLTAGLETPLPWVSIIEANYTVKKE
jgi:hypothetical protein